MFRRRLSGLIVSFTVALLALWLGGFVPLIGSSLLAMLLGIVLNHRFGIKSSWEVGLAYSSKQLLQWAIIILGLTFSIREVSEVGLSSLRLSLLTIVLAFGTAYALGRYLKAKSTLTLLIGFGTAICGGSAIAAASPILEADDDDIALSLATIFCFNLVAVLLFPILGHLLGLSDLAFGLWAGTAINDTSSVLAAAYSYSQVSGDYATIVKLARALMIVPSCLLMVLVKHYRFRHQALNFSVGQLFPWFIVWFLVASVISSLGFFPSAWFVYAKKLSQLLMAMALVGIGSKVSWASVRKAGLRPILVGLVTWGVVAISGLLLQRYLF